MLVWSGQSLPDPVFSLPEDMTLHGTGAQGAAVLWVALAPLAAELGLAERVVFTGRVPNAEVQAYYGLCDVLAFRPASAGSTIRATSARSSTGPSSSPERPTRTGCP